MVKVLIDTSVMIEKTRNKKGLFDLLIGLARKGKIKLYVSSVVLMELWAGKSMNRVGSVKEVEEILKPVTVLVVNESIGKLAGELARFETVLGLDAIIAATALMYGAQLATLNKKYFEGVKGLKLYNGKNETL